MEHNEQFIDVTYTTNSHLHASSHSIAQSLLGSVDWADADRGYFMRGDRMQWLIYLDLEGFD